MAGDSVEDEEDFRGFAPGTHTMVVMDTGRKMAGYVMGWTEDGLYLSVTHKESAMVRTLAPEFYEEALKVMESHHAVVLRAEAVRMFGLKVLFKKLDNLKLMILEKLERDLLAEMDDGVKMRELAVPVKTWINSSGIAEVSSTEDTVVENGVSVMEQTIDKVFGSKDKEEE